jgi:hypothetical protein
MPFMIATRVITDWNRPRCIFPRQIDGKLYRKPDGWHLCPSGAEAIACVTTEEVARPG